MRALFGLALLAIIHFSLFPWRFDVARFSRPLPWLGVGSNSDITDIVINLFFYLPPALIGQWAFQKPKTKLRTLVLIVGGLTLLSSTLEFLQLAIPGRWANLRDIACNAVGALIGASLAYALPHYATTPAKFFARFKLPPQVLTLAVFLIAWATWQAFPFIPHLRLYRLINLPQPFIHPVWPLTLMVDIFFAVVVIYLAALHFRLPALGVTLAACALLPAQAFMREMVISPASLLAAAFALTTAHLFFRHPGRLHYLTLALGISIWLLIRQLAPANFSPHALNTFSWIPFAPLIDISPRAPSIRLLSDKFLLSGAAIWLWTLTGLPARMAAIAIILIVSVTEVLQCYIPGRTPETTDIFLTLLAAWLISSTVNGDRLPARRTN